MIDYEVRRSAQSSLWELCTFAIDSRTDVSGTFPSAAEALAQAFTACERAAAEGNAVSLTVRSPDGSVLFDRHYTSGTARERDREREQIPDQA